MCPPADWFDEIVAGDPLRPDPPPRRRRDSTDDHRAAGPEGVCAGVTEGFDDLFFDFETDERPGAPSRGDADDERATWVDEADDDDLVRPVVPRSAPGPDEATGVGPRYADGGEARLDELGELGDLGELGELEHADDADDADHAGEDAVAQAPWLGELAETAPEEAAYAGEGWAGNEVQTPADAPWETHIDTSLVPPQEMTGVWLTTEAGRESPLRMDGEPIEPEELDLPPDIADRLRDWSDQWRAEWDDDAGWLPRARIGDYEALGHWLARRVKDGAGALDVTLQPAHLGRAGVERIEAAGRRRPILVRLANRHGDGFPVQGDFVTDSGVGSFSAELNAKLEGWAAHFAEHTDPVTGWHDRRAARDHAAFAGELAADMAHELGADYRVELDLWELNGVLDTEGPRR